MWLWACISTVGFARDADRDGFDEASDCDDTDVDIFPGAPEHCDGIDEDCDGNRDGGDVDHDLVPGDCDVCPELADPDQADTDGDGVGDACEPPPPTDDPGTDPEPASDTGGGDPAAAPEPGVPEDGARSGCRGLGVTYAGLLGAPCLLVGRRRR